MAELVRHISLDFWHTLASPNRAYAAQRNRLLAARYKVSLEEADAGYKTLKNRWEAQAIALGTLPAADVLRQEFNRTFNGLLSFSQFEVLRGEMRAHFAALPPHIDRAALEQVFRLMQQGVTFNITSNTNFLIGGSSLQLLLPEFFNFRLWSDQLGVCKPNPHIFQRVVELSQTPAANILHVGDSRKCDYEPARQAGMQAQLCSEQRPTAEILQNVNKELAHAG